MLPSCDHFPSDANSREPVLVACHIQLPKNVRITRLTSLYVRLLNTHQFECSPGFLLAVHRGQHIIGFHPTNRLHRETQYVPLLLVISQFSNPASSPDLDYRHFDSAKIEPRYEFGFGMSYTSFSYSGLSVKTLVTTNSLASSRGTTQPGGDTSLYDNALTVSFTVKNTGAYDGNEVAQLYLVRLYSFVYCRLPR